MSTDVSTINKAVARPKGFVRTEEHFSGHGQGSIHIVPAKLVAVFGPPSMSDEYKVSGEYRFVNEAGVHFTLYDWKVTTLYDSSCMDPADFWAESVGEYEFHLGGEDTVKTNKQAILNFLNESGVL